MVYFQHVVDAPFHIQGIQVLKKHKSEHRKYL